MGDTSETNTKVLSRELYLGVVALKCLYGKIIICATWALLPGTVTYDENLDRITRKLSDSDLEYIVDVWNKK